MEVLIAEVRGTHSRLPEDPLEGQGETKFWSKCLSARHERRTLYTECFPILVRLHPVHAQYISSPQILSFWRPARMCMQETSERNFLRSLKPCRHSRDLLRTAFVLAMRVVGWRPSDYLHCRDSAPEETYLPLPALVPIL